MARLFLLLSIIFSSTPAWSLSNAYVSFDHPPGWECELLQGVWICQGTQEPIRRESIILSIAATASEWDNLGNYERYLKRPKKVQDEDGKVLNSKLKFVRKRKINGHDWVDSLQLNSELPGFYARYLATLHKTKEVTLAVLITYIVSEKQYPKMAPNFERMISSLKLKNDFNLNVASKQNGEPMLGGEVLGNTPASLTQDILKDRLRKQPAEAEAPDLMGGILFLALLMVIIGLVWTKLKQRKRKKPLS